MPSGTRVHARCTRRCMTGVIAAGIRPAACAPRGVPWRSPAGVQRCDTSDRSSSDAHLVDGGSHQWRSSSRRTRGGSAGRQPRQDRRARPRTLIARVPVARHSTASPPVDLRNYEPDPRFATAAIPGDAAHRGSWPCRSRRAAGRLMVAMANPSNIFAHRRHQVHHRLRGRAARRLRGRAQAGARPRVRLRPARWPTS